MANQTVYLVNPTGTAVDNYGGVAAADIPAYGMIAAVLTDAEQATGHAAAPKVLQIGQGASQEERRIASKILRLGKNPGSATS